MRILSVYAARPRTYAMDDGESFETSIFKEPVFGRVWARDNALEGDEPADKEAHGGVHKAVYSYASEHYAYWKKELGTEDLPHGKFGENLTTEGLDENAVWVGDRFRMGEALLEAASPRIPCEMLGFRFRDQSIVKKFLQSGRTGIYYKIVEEGRLGAGDEIRKEKSREDTARIAELAAIYISEDPDKERIARLLKLPELPEDFKAYLSRFCTIPPCPRKKTS